MKKITSKTIIVIMIGLVFSGCGEQAEQEIEATAKTVDIITTTYGFPNGIKVQKSSTLQPKNEVQIVSEGSGKIIELLFEEGDQVRKGQNLARLGETVSNTQSQINQTQATTSLSNAQATLESNRKQADETIRQAEIALSNARSGYENAIRNRDNTKISLQESEKTARLAIETAQSSLQNTKDSTGQSVKSIYENAITTINSSLTTAQDNMRNINNILGVDEEYPDVNRKYSDFLGATDRQSLIDSENNYLKAQSLKISKLSNNESNKNIDLALPKVETYLQAIAKAIDSTDYLLENTLANMYLTQTEIDALRSGMAAYNSITSNSLSAVEQTKQAISSIKIGNNTSLDSAEKRLESAEQQLVAILAGNRVQKENLNHAVNMAEQGLKNAESALNKAKEGSKSSIIAAENNLSSARQQYNLTTLARNNVIITAPISGKITEREMDTGSLVSPGSIIATIAVLDEITMDINYSYAESLYLANKGSVEIYIDGNNQEPITGNITRIAASADPVTRQIAVEITIPNQDEILKPNLLAEAKIPFRKEFFENKILLPLKTVRIGQDQRSVFTIMDGRVTELPIEIGQVYGEYIEILNFDANRQVIAEIGNLQIGELVSEHEPVKFKKPANLGDE